MDVVIGPSVGRPPVVEPAGAPFARRRKRRNTPWIVLGVLLATVGGLGAFLVATSLADRVDVVVAARDLAAGRPLAPDDLTVVAISGGDGARAIAASRRGELVGSASTADVPAGAILHPDQIVAAGDGAERTVIVGAALAPGEYPVTELLPGLEVQIIEVSAETSLGEDEDHSVLLGTGTVVAARPLTRADDLLVSIRVEERLAPIVAERSQQKRVRLVLVEQPGLASSPTPTTTTTVPPTTLPSVTTTVPLTLTTP